MIMLGENGGEVLGGFEAAVQGDLDNRPVGIFAQYSGGGLDPAEVEVGHGGHICQLFTEMTKSGYAQSALFGH